MKIRPSLFDIAIAGMMFIPWIRGDFNRSIFFIFYTAFLFAWSFTLRQNADYRSRPLTLLVLWSLLNVFIHNFCLSKPVASYKNFYIMSEGFLYILFGAIFLRTVIMYSTDVRFVPLLIPIAIFPWYHGLQRTGNSTALVAIGVSIVIYLFLSKKTWYAISASIVGLIAVVTHWSWLVMKFRCRPYVWYQMLINAFYHPARRDAYQVLDPGIELSPFLDKIITHHPFLVSIKPWLASVFGSGFTSYLNGEYVWVDLHNFGWVYRQNDYLNIAGCLGPIALMFIVWWIVQSLKDIGIRPMLIGFMAVLLICFGQLTMFNPGKAGICLTIAAVSIAEGRRGNI